MKQQNKVKKKMPADNKRFGEIGGEVIIRISVCPLTAGDSPNCVQLPPQLRQAAGTLAAICGHSAQTNLRISDCKKVKYEI